VTGSDIELFPFIVSPVGKIDTLVTFFRAQNCPLHSQGVAELGVSGSRLFTRSAIFKEDVDCSDEYSLKKALSGGFAPRRNLYAVIADKLLLTHIFRKLLTTDF
jgi:hypothetical protein